MTAHDESPVGVMLAGGGSRRMGRSKANLPFGNGTLLEWMVRLAREALDEVWVSLPPPGAPVASEAVRVPPAASGTLPDEVALAGPLAALRVALARLDRPVLLVACDLPFLAAEDLRGLARAPRDAEAVLLADAEGPQPLAALYRPSLHPTIETILAGGRRAMRDLLGTIAYRSLPATTAVAGCPPLANLNTPEEHAAAVARARAAGLI